MSEDIKNGETTRGELNRKFMSPRNYFDWLTRNAPPKKMEEILARKRKIQGQITTAVGGAAGFTNEMLDQIVSGEVPDSTVQEWTQIARAAINRSKAEKMERDFAAAGYPTKGSQPSSNFDPET